jgi:hypothetical protein
MSMAQTVIGVVLLSAVATLGLRSVLPEQPRIEVHSITYSDGQITQDRTVNSDTPEFFMRWAAKIEDAATGEVVGNCRGDGSFPYKSGRAARTMALDVWVGNPLCTPASLPPGQYVPVAAFVWGDQQVIARGDIFTIPEADK